jgi:5'-methylthioadenosine nucleosidase
MLASKLIWKTRYRTQFQTWCLYDGNSLDKTDEDVATTLRTMPALKIWKRRPLRGAARYAFAGVKVADIVDGDQPTQDEFVENLHAASISLQEALPWGCFELSTTSIIMSCREQ